MTERRAGSAEIRIRIQAVYKMLLEGWQRHELVPHLMQLYGIKNRQARSYVARAAKLMDKTLERARDRSLAFHISARRQLLRNATRLDDKLKILKDEAQLLGLYERGPTGTKDDPIYNVHDVRTLTDDELFSLAKRSGDKGDRAS